MRTATIALAALAALTLALAASAGTAGTAGRNACAPSHNAAPSNSPGATGEARRLNAGWKPALQAAADTVSHDLEVAQQLEIFSTLYRDLDEAYVDTLDPRETVGTAIGAMLRSLDPYTEYYPRDDTKALRQMITGKYGGIGSVISFHVRDNVCIITEPYWGMPAQRAGLSVGDRILDIDGESMLGRTTAYVSEHLRGEAGTSLMLTVRRPGEKKMRRVRLTRQAIQTPAIPYWGLERDTVGYIALTQFTEGCSQQFRHALIDLKRQGARRLLIDLRGNGGGSLQEAVTILNLFVPRGRTLVTTRGKLEKARAEYKTGALPVDTVMPVAVLVNGETASASEIMAGTLQDLDRGLVVGTRTFGKGLVQTPVTLPYATNAKLTTAHYYIPSGRCIQAIRYRRGSREAEGDTLREYRTAAGRRVRGGRGITPDVVSRADSLPNICLYLMTPGLDSTGVMLDWVARYVNSHETVAPAREFALTEAEWQDFRQAVVASGFRYDRESERFLRDLEKVARFEGYWERARPEFEALERKLRHDLGAELDYHRPQIQRMVESAIVTACHFQAGDAAYRLRSDKQAAAALDALSDADGYRRRLAATE